uniref:Uncharacterized protein n=1 Tax=Physcomitrium patens TaxID=3218 RepID=A0A2K1IP03_PHYPA|nr:hypothetical protein PHYPA_027327 [Physcomitrium patens]
MAEYDVYHVSTLDTRFSTSHMSDLSTDLKSTRELKQNIVDASLCLTINLATTAEPRSIKIYEAFTWTYDDLKGISAEVCEHHIILEENAKPKDNTSISIFIDYRHFNQCMLSKSYSMPFMDTIFN